MSADTETTLEQEVHRLFELLDSMDISGISAMLTDDAQGIDEISRRWMRGKAALDAYFAAGSAQHLAARPPVNGLVSGALRNRFVVPVNRRAPEPGPSHRV